MKKAAELVNSTGGDWGYVTLVIREDDRDSKKWQKFFDELRINHLIPIVRVASKITEKGEWKKLNIDEIDGWVGFFDSLNWVVKNRYIIVGNEVNLAHEWEGKASPKEHSDYLIKISKSLKASSEDYFIMASPFESKTKTGDGNLDEIEYIEKMLNYSPRIFDYIDGWASHSYPYKPLTEEEDLRSTLKHYQWEMQTLRKLGVDKNFPIFITETGWARGFDTSQAELIEEVKKANTEVWSDEKIVAITPFILSYIGRPFENYSWTDENGEFYEFAKFYQSIPKNKGKPVQIDFGEVVSYLLPRIFKTKNGNFYGLMYIQNKGQAIWENGKRSKLTLKDKSVVIIPLSFFKRIPPGGKVLALYSIESEI